MLIRRAEAEGAATLEMEGVRGVRMQVMVGRADGAANFALRHFVVEPGGHTPRHSHDYEHQVYIVEGRADVECDGAVHEARSGDVLHIEPNRVHQFRNPGDAPLRFLCMVPTTFDCGRPTPGS
ncbi:MAG TPA: cupin domain-containing protein [Phycisphaerales bacterium]|nr:cupin domain-containing protein [Phycisphaerales bacterium]HMP37442.1 cupin domain-containing protein [Phycisphaerales bacterium]